MSQEHEQEPEVPQDGAEAELDHRIKQDEGERVKVNHLVTLGDNDSEMFCVQFDKDDKYVACGK